MVDWSVPVLYGLLVVTGVWSCVITVIILIIVAGEVQSRSCHHGLNVQCSASLCLSLGLTGSGHNSDINIELYFHPAWSDVNVYD